MEVRREDRKRKTEVRREDGSQKGRREDRRRKTEVRREEGKKGR